MRIITGKLRGMKLFSPTNTDIRPTADRVKESVFNILGFNFESTMVLDLFSGTGNLGLEAWSRGAEHVLFVDKSRGSINLLKKNIEKASVGEMVSFIQADVLKYIKILFEQEKKFDYIFADPPYNKGHLKFVIEELDKYDILTPKGTIIIEHAYEEFVDLIILNRLSLFRKEKYGETQVSFFKKI